MSALAAGPLPAKAKADAVHLAMASVYRLDYLLTWNLKHLANAMILGGCRRWWNSSGLCCPWFARRCN